MSNLKKYTDQYIENAKTYMDEQNLIDYKVTNLAYDKMIEALVFIFNKDNQLKCISELMQSSDDRVRLSAATDTLTVDESKALRVLKEISKKKGMLGFTASMVIEEWNKGNLANPFWKQ